MSTSSERQLRSQAAGYWAVEIRLGKSIGHGKQYLCRAANDRGAIEIASHLMGSAVDVRGFNYFWIDTLEMPKSSGSLPMCGAYREVLDLDEWSCLMIAHEASQTGAH